MENKTKELGISKRRRQLSVIPEFHSNIGETKESLVQADFAERQRYLNRLEDTIRGIPLEDNNSDGIVSRRNNTGTIPPKIVALTDKGDQQLVVVGINALDRNGLLLDIAKTLTHLGLNLHRTEAVVVEGRSLSLWRCEVIEDGVTDIEEIWSALNAMLEINSGVEVLKSKGVRVIRAIVPKSSMLIGVTASDVNFREKYKCAIIAMQRDGASPPQKLSQTKFAVGDVLVLQTNDDSPLLVPPPKDFYKNRGSKGMTTSRSNNSLARFVRNKFGSFGSVESLTSKENEDTTLDIENQQRLSPKRPLNVDDDSASSGEWVGEGEDEMVVHGLTTMTDKVSICICIIRDNIVQLHSKRNVLTQSHCFNLDSAAASSRSYEGSLE